MTVSYTAVTPDRYDCDGVQTEFGFTFRIFEDTDLRVILIAADGAQSVLEPPTQYAVSEGPWDTGPTYGTVTLAEAPVDGEILLKPNIPATQSTDLFPHGRFPAEQIERGLDRLALIAQQQRAENGRCIRLPETESGGQALILPVAAARKGRGLRFDDNGNIGITERDPDEIFHLAAESADAAASASGSASEARDAAQNYRDEALSYRDEARVSQDSAAQSAEQAINSEAGMIAEESGRFRRYLVAGVF